MRWEYEERKNRGPSGNLCLRAACVLLLITVVVSFREAIIIIRMWTCLVGWLVEAKARTSVMSRRMRSGVRRWRVAGSTNYGRLAIDE